MRAAGEQDHAVPWEQSLYDELRPLAEAAFRHEGSRLSLQPTMLLNDAYLKLKQQRNLEGARRKDVLAAGVKIMRRLIIDHCRRQKADKRGGGAVSEPLAATIAAKARSEEVIELHESLARLEQRYPRAGKIVELRYFGGLTAELTAQHLQVSLSTVNSDWRFAKAWLERDLRQQ